MKLILLTGVVDIIFYALGSYRMAKMFQVLVKTSGVTMERELQLMKNSLDCEMHENTNK